VNDIDDVLLQARDALSGARMEIPVEAILAKGRSRRHRRRLVQLSAAGVAASGCLALGLAAVVGSGSPSPVPGTIRTAAFTLARNPNGTTSLKLNQHQTFDPAALQQALARDGIPALVHIGIFCKSTPAPPSSGVVSIQFPDGSPVPVTGRQTPVPPDALTVINPAVMPAGTELSFTYLNRDRGRALTGSLIYTAAHTCSSTPPAGPVPAG
jgi:hypothetical protein